MRVRRGGWVVTASVSGCVGRRFKSRWCHFLYAQWPWLSYSLVFTQANQAFHLFRVDKLVPALGSASGWSPSYGCRALRSTKRMHLKTNLLSSHSLEVAACAAIRHASYMYRPVCLSTFRRPPTLVVLLNTYGALEMVPTSTFLMHYNVSVCVCVAWVCGWGCECVGVYECVSVRESLHIGNYYRSIDLYWSQRCSFTVWQMIFKLNSFFISQFLWNIYRTLGFWWLNFLWHCKLNYVGLYLFYIYSISILVERRIVLVAKYDIDFTSIPN